MGVNSWGVVDMRGKIKITVECTDESRIFPITNKFCIESDNTFETIHEWLNTFKTILYSQGFSDKLIEEYLGEKEV